MDTSSNVYIITILYLPPQSLPIVPTPPQHIIHTVLHICQDHTLKFLYCHVEQVQPPSIANHYNLAYMYYTYTLVYTQIP